MGNIEEVIVRCGGDDTTVSFAWNSLRELDLSNNNISKLGNSLVRERCNVTYIYMLLKLHIATTNTHTHTHTHGT